MKSNTLYIMSFLLLAFSILSGCSGGALTERKAEKLIKKFYDYPNVEAHTFNLSIIVKNAYASMIQDGYLEVPQTHGMMFPDLIVTPKSLPYRIADTSREGYVSYLYATNMRKLKEVTMVHFIDDTETRATVEYTCVRYNLTPFGKQNGYTENEEVKYTVYMDKSSKGWRIASHKGKNFTKKDFPDVEEF